MAYDESGATTDWLSARVRATPHKAFLHVEAETVSFADVDRLVSATTAIIRAHTNVSAGDHVALLMTNGLASVVSLLALMRLGAVIVPLNTRLTADELKWQFTNSDCRLLICERDGEARARALTDAVLVFPGVSSLAATDEADARRELTSIVTSPSFTLQVRVDGPKRRS